MKLAYILGVLVITTGCANSNDPPGQDSLPNTGLVGDGDGDPGDPDDSDPGDSDDDDGTPGDGTSDDDGDPTHSEGGTNIPPDTVLVGGAPATCEVYELDIPVQQPEGQHVPEGTEVTYDYNPPAGGPSYEMWAAYRQYDEVVAREHWVHNLRHGAIVLIYRPDAPQEVIDALATAYPLLPTPGGKYSANAGCPSMGIMTADPELDETFAVMSFGKMLTSNCVPQTADILDFAERNIYEGNEKECWDGAWPVRGPCFRYEDVRKFEWTREIPEGQPATYADYPPSSGPYYANTLRYGRYEQMIDAPYWMGILAKGGIVVLYRPDAPAEMIDALKVAYDALPLHHCGHTMTAMVPDASIPTPYAIVGFGHYLDAQCFEGWEMEMFVTSRRGWGMIRTCDDGTYEP